MTAFLHEYVARQAERRPDSVAVVMGDAAMTYGEIEQESGRIAHLLTQLGCRRGERVCLLVEKSPRAIASAIGTLKAGCSYVPLDVNSPVLRAEKIVRATDPKVIVADERAFALLQELGLGACSMETPIVSTSAAPAVVQGLVTATASDWMQLDSTFAPLGRSADDPAHILFTSGSTGMPKGVVVTHANVTAFIEWAVGYFGTRPTDRISGHPPLHFDLSTFDIYGTFRAGAELHLVPPEKNLLPSALADFIRSSRLHQWFAVPSVFTMIAASDALGEDDIPSLERVLWCGEVLPTSALRYWMERLPRATFTNLYGPTETTIASSFHTVTRPPLDDVEPIPIGRACDGEALHVLDERLTPVASGEVGEIYIGGVGVSPGYWRDAETTHRAFLRDPFGAETSAQLYRTGDLGRRDDDGLVYFVGRADSQIKHRGHRVELGEVEIAVNALAAVGEAVVIATPTKGFEGNHICCAYVPAQGVDEGARVLRRVLRRTLPEYMIPTKWLRLAALPKNANGKVDRPRIRDLFDSTVAEHPPSASSRLGATAKVST